MTTEGSGPQPGSGAFQPWSPRAGATGPGEASRGVPSSPPVADGPVLGGRAPVADDQRPPGAASTPPTGWPAPTVPSALVPGSEPLRRSNVLLILCAFLLGSLLVGAAFAAYAAGRGDDPASSAASTTTTALAPANGSKGLDIQRILDIARPSVVTIQTGSPNSPFGGAGSGVVISQDGLILTNAHVIEGAGGNIAVRFNDGTTAKAALVGASTNDDIALIKADSTGLTPAKLGSSDNLLQGDPVVAIGNALNLGADPSVTLGIVSAKDRQISEGTIRLKHLIQTDAAINPGNSGGPLVNAAGEVVGINTAIIKDAQNIGFSIAIDSVKDLIETLKAGGGNLTADTAVLGVSAIDVTSPDLPQTVKDQFKITAEAGAVIVAVDPAGGGSKAGLLEGDVVVEFGSDAVGTASELTNLVRGHQPGDEVTVAFERQGQRRTATVTLGP